MNFVPKVIIGLGNPGPKFMYNRHNIGFLVVDELARIHGGQWRTRENMESAMITIHDQSVLLVKPMTYMNTSGSVVPFLKKQGIEAQNALVVHDELEHPFSKMTMRIGGSARGHNGLKSLITYWGEGFGRLRFGIGRPEQKEQVPDYVLENFTDMTQTKKLITQACEQIEQLYEKK